MKLSKDSSESINSWNFALMMAGWPPTQQGWDFSIFHVKGNNNIVSAPRERKLIPDDSVCA